MPERLQAHVPLFFGDRAEVERVEQYHADHVRGDDRPFTHPLFGQRSLFVD